MQRHTPWAGSDGASPFYIGVPALLSHLTEAIQGLALENSAALLEAHDIIGHVVQYVLVEGTDVSLLLRVFHGSPEGFHFLLGHAAEFSQITVADHVWVQEIVNGPANESKHLALTR